MEAGRAGCGRGGGGGGGDMPLEARQIDNVASHAECAIQCENELSHVQAGSTDFPAGCVAFSHVEHTKEYA